MAFASSDVTSQQHLDTRRRMVSPMAIGRKPPPGLFRAISGAPAMKGASSRGALPSTRWFVNFVRAFRASVPTELLGQVKKSLKN